MLTLRPRGPPDMQLRVDPGEPPENQMTLSEHNTNQETMAVEAINSLFTNLLNIGLGVAVTVAAFFIMWGAFLYMSAAGSPHQMEKGKSAMVNAIAGLAIVLSARVIAGMIQSALGAGS